MSLSVLALSFAPSAIIPVIVLCSALLHASWNAMVKSGKDVQIVQSLVIFTPGLITFFMIPFVPLPKTEAVPFMIASALVHYAYGRLLVASYRHGDLSLVYPIARGSAPVMVTLGAWFFVGEAQTPLEMAAILLVSLGIFALSAKDIFRGKGKPKNAAVPLALLTGISIATYSLIDGLGGRAAGDVLSYVVWSFTLQAPMMLIHSWHSHRGQFLPVLRANLGRGLLGGAISGLAYGIVIWAMSIVPLGQVVALRETSVLVAALIGTFLLKEPFGRQRVAAAGLIVSGVALLQLVG